MTHSYDIVGVGHSCLDSLCTVECYPKENSSTHITSIQTQGGGAVATALVAASRLGMKTAMIGNLGDDACGQEILQMLTDEHVDVSGVRRIPQERSSVSYVLIDPATGSRTKFPYPDALPPIAWDEQQRALLQQAAIVHLDGTAYANAMSAARMAKEYGVTVSLDGCSVQKDDNAKNKALASMADILIMNAKYPLLVSGEDSYEKALLTMAGWGPKILMCTLGEEGSMAVMDGRVARFPAFKVQAVDTTGAGDVFHGAFITGWHKGMSLTEGVRFASAVSALKCLQIGGRKGIPTMAQALNFLKEHQA